MSNKEDNATVAKWMAKRKSRPSRMCMKCRKERESETCNCGAKTIRIYVSV